jgi:hypothetical protein
VLGVQVCASQLCGLPGCSLQQFVGGVREELSYVYLLRLSFRYDAPAPHAVGCSLLEEPAKEVVEEASAPKRRASETRALNPGLRGMHSTHVLDPRWLTGHYAPDGHARRPHAAYFAPPCRHIRFPPFAKRSLASYLRLFRGSASDKSSRQALSHLRYRLCRALPQKGFNGQIKCDYLDVGRKTNK